MFSTVTHLVRHRDTRDTRDIETNAVNRETAMPSCEPLCWSQRHRDTRDIETRDGILLEWFQTLRREMEYY